MNRVWMLALVPTMLAGGCRDQVQSHEGRRIDLAVGATVTLLFEDCRQDEDRLDERCLVESATDVIDAELVGGDGVITLDATELDLRADQVSVTTTALGPGEATLVVRYQRFDDQFEDRFLIRSSDPTRVEATVDCLTPIDAGSILPISVGAAVELELAAWADGVPLATGHAGLIASGRGLDVDGRTLTAPEQPGEYTVPLISTGSDALRFVVYEPQDVGIALAEALVELGRFPDTIQTAAVQLTPTLDGAPVCRHSVPTRIHARATSDTCDIVLGGYAFDGDIPLDLSEDALLLPVEGKGRPCTIEAVSPGQMVTELAVVSHPRDIPLHGTIPVGEDPVTVRFDGSAADPCTRATDITYGDCEVLDDGWSTPRRRRCVDYSWDLRYRDLGASDQWPAYEALGVGLTSELHGFVEFQADGTEGSYGPAEMELQLEPELGLTSEFLGCVQWPDDSHPRGVVELLPELPGTYDLRLRSSNSYGLGRLDVQAEPVDAVAFETLAGDDVAIEDDVTTTHVFVGSTTDIAIQYRNADGLRLGGHAPFRVSTDRMGTNTAIEGQTAELFTGRLPHQIWLASDIAPQQHVLDVVDTDGIADVEGLEDSSLTADEPMCLLVQPLAADGHGIHGRLPTRPRVTVGGDSAVVVLDHENLAAHDPWVGDEVGPCFRSQNRGDITVEVQWGSATRSAVWTTP